MELDIGLLLDSRGATRSSGAGPGASRARLFGVELDNPPAESLAVYFRTNVVGTLRPALRAHAGGGCGCGAGAVGLPDRCRVPVPVSGRRQPGASWAAGRVRQPPAPLGACCCNRARSNLFALCSLTAASRFEIWRSPLPWAPPTAAVAREAHRQRALVVELDVGLSLDSRGAGDQVPLAVPGLVGRACSASSSTPRRALAVYFCTNLVGTLRSAPSIWSSS